MRQAGLLAVAACLAALLCASCATQGPAYITCGLERYVADLQYGDLQNGLETVRIAGTAGAPIEMGAGTYSLGTCAIEHTDADGVKWTITGFAQDVEIATVVLGKTTTLSFGPPLKAELAYAKRSGSLIFQPLVRGCAGETYPPAAITRGNGNAPVPSVEIRDASGKLLATGKFEYG